MSKNKDRNLELLAIQAELLGKLRDQRNFWMFMSIVLGLILIWRIL